MATPTPAHPSFEAWATSHGGFNLERTKFPGTTTGGWPFATYHDHATEAAWRAWANKPAPDLAPAPSTADLLNAYFAAVPRALAWPWPEGLRAVIAKFGGSKGT